MKKLMLKFSSTFIFLVFCMSIGSAQTSQTSMSKKIANYTPKKVEVSHTPAEARSQKVKTEKIAKKFSPNTSTTQSSAKVKAPRILQLTKKD